jgi:hypothetical protein
MIIIMRQQHDHHPHHCGAAASRIPSQHRPLFPAKIQSSRQNQVPMNQASHDNAQVLISSDFRLTRYHGPHNNS